MKKRVLLLMSDTGGGHRASAEAIQTELYATYGEDAVEVELVDVFRQSSFPMNMMPEFYPWLIKHSQGLWGLGYQVFNTKAKAKLLAKLIYQVNRRRLQALAQNNQADVVVSVHSVITSPAFWAWKKLEKRPPFLAVITNLISTHPIGYNPDLELIMVPNQIAFEQGRACDMPIEKLEITGLAVNPRFSEALKGKQAARESLGWDTAKPSVLMLAGGDGVGNLYEQALAINALGLDIQVAIVTGRNQALKAQLEALEWRQKTYIYPFVNNMPELMAAADILITKAGPSSISEAAIAALPMLLIAAIPGQETANIAYVVENGAGLWCPQTRQLTASLQKCLGDSALLTSMSANAQKLAYPNATSRIAERIMEWASQPPIENDLPSL